MSYVNSNTGDHPHDALAAYALDAVDLDERRLIESHLAVCVSCRRELTAHEEVLSRMVVDERPPAAVWERIVEETRPGARPGPSPASDGSRPPHGEVAPPPTTLESARHRRDERSGRQRPRRLTAALAAAAAVLALAGVGSVVVANMGDGGEPEVAGETVGVIEATDGSGTELAAVTVDEEGASFVDFTGAATLPDTRTYQLWSLDSGQPESLGVLGTGEDDVVRVSLPEGTTMVAISNEPAGGSEAPTQVVGQGEVALPA